MIYASLFVAILPFSNHVYAEVFKDERAVNWITAHRYAWKPR